MLKTGQKFYGHSEGKGLLHFFSFKEIKEDSKDLVILLGCQGILSFLGEMRR